MSWGGHQSHCGWPPHDEKALGAAVLAHVRLLVEVDQVSLLVATEVRGVADARELVVGIELLVRRLSARRARYAIIR